MLNGTKVFSGQITQQKGQYAIGAVMAAIGVHGECGQKDRRGKSSGLVSTLTTDHLVK